MTILEAIIIGLIQGLTEFLPVSSSGHIILAERILGVSGDLGFTLVLHLATLLAVVIVLRKRVLATIKAPRSWVPLLVATACSFVTVVAIKGLLGDALEGRFLPTCFLITAAMLLISGLIKPRAEKTTVSVLDAAIIGCVQGIAVLPGISRSGSTVSTGVMLGNDRAESVSFSFLLSIPIIVGSALIDLLTEGVGSVRFLPLLFGFASAFISGLVSAKLMLSITSKAFDFFALYLTALSVFLLLNDLVLHLF